MGSEKALKAVSGRLSDTQKQSVAAIKQLARVTGVNFVFFESQADNTGRYTAENGHYDVQTGTIYLDLNSGKNSTTDLAEYAILRTAGHELTHFMEHSSKEGYAALRDFVTTELNRRGEDFDALVVKKMDNAARSGAPLTRAGAISEVVADASELMLRDTKAIERLARKDQGLMAKIKGFIQSFVQKVRDAFSGVDAVHEEARVMMQELAEEFQKKWDFALEEAVEQAREGAEVQDGESVVQYSPRERSTVDVRETTVEDGKNNLKYVRQLLARNDRSENHMYIPIIGRLNQGFLDLVHQENLPVVMRVSKAMQAVASEKVRINGGHGHDLTPAEITEAVAGIDENTATFYNEEIDRWAAISEKNGKTILLFFDFGRHINSDLMYGMRTSGNHVVVTAFSRKNAEDAMAYFNSPDSQYKKTPAAEATGARSSPSLTVKVSNNSIPENSAVDNREFAENQESLREQTETPEFKRWFGDSEIVDENGEPLVVYHTTYSDFYKFDRRKLGKNTDNNASDVYIAATAHVGFWFNEKSLVKTMGGKAMPVYLSAKRVYEVGTLDALVEEIWDYYQQQGYKYDPENLTTKHAAKAGRVYADMLQSRRYDGIAVDDTEFGGMSYVVFDSEQIKSAVDNVGTFDSANPDIRYSLRDMPADLTREYVANLTASDALNDVEKDAIRIYSREVKLLRTAQEKLDKVIAERDAQPEDKQKMYAQRVRDLRQMVSRHYDRLSKLEKTKGVAPLIQRSWEYVQEYVQGKTAQDVENLITSTEQEVERLNKLIQAGNKDLVKERDRRVRDLRQLRNKATQALVDEQERYRQMIATDREVRKLTQQARQMQEKIATRVRKLDKLRRHETDYKNIPEAFKPAVDTLVSMFTDNFGTMVFDTTRADRLASIYHKLLAVDGNDPMAKLSPFYDPDVEAQLDALKELAERDAQLRSSSGMTRMEKATLRLAINKGILEAVDHITAIVTNAQNLFYAGKKAKFSSIGVSIGNELMARQDKKTLRGAAGQALTVMDNLLRTGNLTPVYFFEQLGNEVLSTLWDDIRQGQNAYAFAMRDGRETIQGLQKLYHYWDWADSKRKDNVLEITTEKGRKLTFTREQALWVYATWKREQSNEIAATKHLTEGGIVYEGKTQEGGKVVTTVQSTPAVLSEGDIARITGWLTDEQKAYADGMVKYLSKDMADLGNRASMEMFGIRKYTESYYFPYRTAGDQLYQSSASGRMDTTSDSRLKHASFTHALTKGASAPLVMGDFSAAVEDHIARMATYASFVLPIESMNRVLNYKVELDDGSRATVRSLIEQKYGESAKKYIATPPQRKRCPAAHRRHSPLAWGRTPLRPAPVLRRNTAAVLWGIWAMSPPAALAREQAASARPQTALGYPRCLSFRFTSSPASRLSNLSSAADRAASASQRASVLPACASICA